MSTPKGLRFARTHEWVRLKDDSAVIGISDFAQEQLSDVTYVELPEVGDHLEAHDECGVVESVKAASDIYAPIAGTVTEINTHLAEHPERVNADPYEAGWLFKIKPDNPADFEELLDVDQYDDSLPEEE